MLLLLLRLWNGESACSRKNKEHPSRGHSPHSVPPSSNSEGIRRTEIHSIRLAHGHSRLQCDLCTYAKSCNSNT